MTKNSFVAEVTFKEILWKLSLKNVNIFKPVSTDTTYINHINLKYEILINLRTEENIA